MKRFGKELKFISVIGRDGSAIYPIQDGTEVFDDIEFKLIRLSFDRKTFIAFENLNFYVVKLKCDL